MTPLRSVFIGKGEMAGRMRDVDWAATPLGPVHAWPQSLRSALGICIESGFPIAIYWGPDLTLLYNDGWMPIPGEKHPWALGRPAREVWPEIWSAIGPLFEQVLSTGTATYLQDALLLMHRHGYTEECYFNYTFTPIRGEGGVIEGIFNAVVETTYRVIAERRSALLRETAHAVAGPGTVPEICVRGARALASPGRDATFALVYLFEEATAEATLVASEGLGGHTASTLARLSFDDAHPWPMRQLALNPDPVVVDHLDAEQFPGGAWPEHTHTVIAVPLLTGASQRPSGCLVLGVSPRRAVDDAYLQFAGQAGTHLAAAVSSAMALDVERQRAERLAALDRAKTAFFSNVSHEFRTPLTLLMGPLEDAVASEPAVLQGPDLVACHRNAGRLLNLVNGLLDFVRIESGRVDAHFEVVDIGVLTAEYASTFRAAIERAGLRLRISRPTFPTDIYVDREMWETVVLNLLSNAFKFTFAGEIAIDIEQEADVVRVRVSDTGVGIADEHLPRVFDRFYRIDQPRSRTHEGSGIGLALARELVALHGGDIRVESVLGQGTTFTISLRRGRSHLPADRIVTHPRPTARRAPAFVSEMLRWVDTAGGEDEGDQSRSEGGVRHRVLVADDNADLREYITRLLTPIVSVSAVATGAEALRLLGSSAFDLVLTDVMMPDMDGFELLARIRADERLRGMPVVVLSARAGEEARLDGLERMADDCIVKPFSARELIAKTVNHLALARVRREVQGELEAARDAAEEANHAKDEFLAVLGHELRNPLSPIVTALQLLRQRGQESRELAVIARQVKHLTRLVDDLLDVSRITRGKVELDRRPINLAEVVSRAVELAAPLLEQRQQHLGVDVPAGVVVDGDIDRLAQVLGNVLANASKYSDPEGRIAISASVRDDRAVIVVSDEGIGIPRDMLERVFEPFVQPPQSSDRSHGGLGLGLAIARSLVDRHGGSIRAESDGPGKGSRFVVELPLAPTVSLAADLTPAYPMRVGTIETGKGRVLVVDDNMDAAEMLGRALAQAGYAVRLAHDGPAALEVARAFQPSAALLDIGLPVMDGHELAARLRAEVSETMALIAVTGYGEDYGRARSSSLGFAAHLVKPVDFALLAQLLERVIAERGPATSTDGVVS